MTRNNLLVDPDGLWAQLERANMIPEMRMAMAEIVRRILRDPRADPLVVDLVLRRCGTRPIFFELGMSVVMIATPEVREAFRARLVECGAFPQAIRLGGMITRPLSRDEVVQA